MSNPQKNGAYRGVRNHQDEQRHAQDAAHKAKLAAIEKTRLREYTQTVIEQRAGRNGQETTVIKPKYSDKGAGPDIVYGLMDGLRGMARTFKDVKNRTVEHAGETANNVLVAAGIKDPPPLSAAEQLEKIRRIRPVATFEAGWIKTSNQADRYFEQTYKESVALEARQSSEDDYLQYQLHGGKLTFEEWLPKRWGQLDVTEFLQVKSSNGNITKVHAFKDRPALVAAGAPTPRYELGVNPGDRYWLMEQRINNDAQDAEILAHTPLGPVIQGTGKGLIVLNRYNKARNDEYGRRIGVLTPEQGEFVQNIAIDLANDQIAKPQAKKLVATMCSKIPVGAKVSPQMCETLAEELLNSALDEAAERAKK